MKNLHWITVVALVLLVAASGCQQLQSSLPVPATPPTPAILPLPTTRDIATATPAEGVAEHNTGPTEEQAASPTVEPVSTPVQPGIPDEQADAMLPAARGDLGTLRDLTHYTIRVTIDYDNLTFEGQEVVDYTNTERTPLDKLNFRLFPNGGRSYGNGALTVSRVTVDGEPVEPELSLEDTVLQVRLPAILKRGKSAQLVLQFQGTVPRDFGATSERSGYGIYNFSDGVMALADWYPILAVFDDEGWNLDPPSAVGDSVYSDAAFYTVDVTTRSDVVVAATGVEVGREVLNGTTHYRYVSGPARDFFLVLSPDFKAVTDSVDGVTINSYYLPRHETGGQTALRVAVGALKTYDQHFGPYPYVELDVIDAPMKNAAGVEYPGIVLIGDFLYDNSRNPFFGVATAHEVAHQWWYNVVGNDVIDEPWLDEALTTFSSAVYVQDIEGQNAFQQNVEQWTEGYDQAVQKGEDDLVTRPMGYWDQPAHRELYGTIVYLKGALFFQAVRDEIGDDAFFRALRTYHTTEKYKIASADDLLNAFEEAVGRQLDDLYQKWLYSATS